MIKKQYQYMALVTNVVDGDTVDVSVSLGFYMTAKLRMRLNSINTPELNATDLAVRARALQAKQWLTDKTLNKTFLIESHRTEKFGRWLVTIYNDDGTTVNQQLLDNKLADPYQY